MAAKEWMTMPLSEAVLINPNVPLERGKVYPFVDMQAVDPNFRSVRTNHKREFAGGGGSRFAVGDTLMARITPCLENGKIARFAGAGSDAVGHGSTEFIVIRGRPGVSDNDFAYYLTRWDEVRQYAIAQMTGTSGRQRVPTESLRHVEIKLPPIPEQKAIARILGALDDKIELNDRMNRTLEAMARALFWSWFVDFDPVCAKAEGRDTGLPKDIADVFPDSFEDSELGEIPKGWRVVRLREIAGVNERSIKKDYPNDIIQYVDISSVVEGRLKGTTTYEISVAPSRARRLVRHGDTIWSSVRPNRRSYLFIHTPPENLVVSTGFAVLTPRLVPACYLYAAVTTDQFVDYLSYAADGSAYPAVLPGRFEDAPVLFPAQHVLLAFERQVAGLRDQIAINDREARSVAQTRDALLPKLLSGEIWARSMKKPVEGAP